VYRVILGLTSGYLSGVDVFSVNLARACSAVGIDARILLMRPHMSVDNPLPLPRDVRSERLPVGIHDLWRTRRQVMIQYLEDQAPCIYVPNYLTEYSCISPRLSHRVGIVGIVHSDDPVHYDHVETFGEYWNAIVAVSEAIAEHTVSSNPTFAPRLVTIPYGVSPSASFPQRGDNSDGPLRIVYAGRVVQHQKRVMDLPEIMRRLTIRKVPARLTVIGNGDARRELMLASKALMAQDRVRFRETLPNDVLLPAFEEHDVIILTSSFEGLPVVLLEAMGRGCVPVTADVRSGIPQLVEDGTNGFRVPVGDIEAFVDRLAVLYRDAERRRQMAECAFRTIAFGRFHIDAMANQYVRLFERVLDEAHRGIYRRPPARIPIDARTTWKDRLPVSVRAVGFHGKRLGRRIAAFCRSRSGFEELSGPRPSE
jgi:glycosyltransferase involved in cell wall biosynthesis